MLLFAHLQDTLDFNGLENTSFPINIVKRSLLRLYRPLQIERGPCRAEIAETGRQGACELVPGGNAARWRCVLLIRAQHYITIVSFVSVLILDFIRKPSPPLNAFKSCLKPTLFF